MPRPLANRGAASPVWYNRYMEKIKESCWCVRCEKNLPSESFRINTKNKKGLPEKHFRQPCKDCFSSVRRGISYSVEKNGLRKCNICQRELQVSSFGEHGKSHPGLLKRRCKTCDHLRIVSDKRDRLYKITPQEYEQMFISQCGGCAICGVKAESLSRSLSVDHDHKTGNVRGLLCSRCNTGIGLLGDSVEIILLAMRYLEKGRS